MVLISGKAPDEQLKKIIAKKERYVDAVFRADRKSIELNASVKLVVEEAHGY